MAKKKKPLRQHPLLLLRQPLPLSQHLLQRPPLLPPMQQHQPLPQHLLPSKSPKKRSSDSPLPDFCLMA